ncbi:hypothetical protein VPH35_104723 [Triticum aestivum]
MASPSTQIRSVTDRPWRERRASSSISSFCAAPITLCTRAPEPWPPFVEPRDRCPTGAATGLLRSSRPSSPVPPPASPHLAFAAPLLHVSSAICCSPAVNRLHAMGSGHGPVRQDHGACGRDAPRRRQGREDVGVPGHSCVTPLHCL